MKRFWMSWYQPTEDSRPIYNPKKEKAPLNHLYWETGWRDSDGARTMCAVVVAPNLNKAMSIIRKYWPEVKEWRFRDQVEPKWMPPSDRFPVKSPRRAKD